MSYTMSMNRLHTRRAILLGVSCAAIFGLFLSAKASVFYNTFDGSRPKDFSIIKKDGLWYMIGIHAWDGAGPPGPASDGLILATSQDLAHWVDVGVAIPVGDTGAWDSYDIWAPSIIKVGSTYHIYYAGVQAIGNQIPQKIGHATSTDLITWTKDPNPVHDCSTTTWQYWNMSDPDGVGTECRDPYVIRDEANNRWVMFFNARANSPINDPVNPAIRWHPHPAVIGMAFSTDLVTWTDGGYLPATAGYQAESPHAFVHNGTWYLAWTNNCVEVTANGTYTTSSTCVKVATASALTGPYGAYTNLAGMTYADFASEYFTDGGTNEYFGRSVGYGIAFDQVTWTNDVFGIAAIPFGTIIGSVWLDSNRNGRIDLDEPGIDSARLETYLDDGDGVFDENVDLRTGTSTTFYNATLTSLRHGTYRFTNVPIGLRTWVRPMASSFINGALTGYVSTTGNMLSQYVPAGTATTTGMSYGFQSPDTTAPAAVTNLR